MSCDFGMTGAGREREPPEREQPIWRNLLYATQHGTRSAHECTAACEARPMYNENQPPVYQ